VNTPQGNGFTRGPKASFSVSFASPIALPDPGSADPWLLVSSTGQAVRLRDRSSEGYPFAMLLPSDWAFPSERTDIGLAYPALVDFVKSSGSKATDWYRNANAALVRPWPVAEWAW
jgi:hypothetical protein